MRKRIAARKAARKAAATEAARAKSYAITHVGTYATVRHSASYRPAIFDRIEAAKAAGRPIQSALSAY